MFEHNKGMQPRKSRRYLFSIILLPLLASFLSGCASKLMLHPELARKMERSLSPSEFSQRQAKKIEVQNDAGHLLHALLFETEGDAGTVMVSGGNAMSRTHTLEYYKFLVGHGFRVLVFSFQGYDENEGSAELDSLIGDAAAYVAYLKSNYPGENIAYLGHSISSAVALCLPLRAETLSAIIIEGALDPKSIVFTKLKQLWYLLPLYPVLLPTAIAINATIPDTLDVAKCITAYSDIPIIFIHHPHDVVTPYEQAFELFSNYRGNKQFFIPRHATPPQYHANLQNDMEIQNRIIQFLQAHLSAEPR